MMNSALDLQDALANAKVCRGQARKTALMSADQAIGRLRIYLRMVHHWKWLTNGQYEHVSRMIAEIGRLLGGWLKRERSTR